MPGIPEYMNQNMRVMQFIFEATGQSVTTEYSTDGGQSWAATQGAGGNVTSLTSIFTDYQQFFEADAKRIRFRFLNSIASSGFQIRHYGYLWLPRTGRR